MALPREPLRIAFLCARLAWQLDLSRPLSTSRREQRQTNAPPRNPRLTNIHVCMHVRAPPPNRCNALLINALLLSDAPSLDISAIASVAYARATGTGAESE